jgi:oligoendopeptidase F
MLSGKQTLLNYNAPLTMAETASTFGEQLVFNKMMKLANSDDEKIATLARKIEDSIATIIRQVAFVEFEKKIHALAQKGNLSYDDFTKVWMETQREALGNDVTIDENYQNMWMYISHFVRSPFYVYSYPFGDMLANSLYSVYQSGKIKDFQQKYMAVLQLGGSKNYREALAPIGVDPSKKEFWEGGIKMISKMIDNLELMLAKRNANNASNTPTATVAGLSTTATASSNQPMQSPAAENSALQNLNTGQLANNGQASQLPVKPSAEAAIKKHQSKKKHKVKQSS